MSHNLEALTAFDFESLAKTVLDETLGVDLEIYKAGRDGGIDLRHAWSGDAGQLIVQCKHTPAAKIGSLRSQFKNVELPKVRELKPQRYVIFTSAGLTRANKSLLKSDLAPFVTRESDIYGRQQIEYFLDTHPDAVRAHLRLWLSNSSVLQSVLNQDVALRSADLMRRIKSQLSTFVDTPALARAQDILRQQRVCLITGPPGIGKTTLAHILCAELVALGYEAIQVTGRISEALKLWQEGKKQVFVFDDFLGRSARGDLIERNEDEDIPGFAERVHAAGDKCFIMTTRGYILGQARVIYDRLSKPALKLAECLLELEDLDLRSRSLILYNHVWASQLEPAEKALFSERDVYWPILDHKNYSPRLVSLSLERYSRERNEHALTAPQIMLRNLDNPAELWDHAIARQLPDEPRGVLDVFATIGAQVGLSQLRDIWTDALDTGHEPTSEDRFERYLAVLEGDFLTVGGPSDTPIISSANPSIDDYMAGRLRERPRMLGGLLNRTPSFSHVEGIHRLFSYRANFGAAEAAKSSWKVVLQPKVFDAYRRLIGHSDPLSELKEIDRGERFRRLAKLWSVVDTDAQTLIALDLTAALLRDSGSKVGLLTLDCFGEAVALLGQLEQFPDAYNLHEMLVQQLIDLVTESAFSWDEARSALSHVETLSSPDSRSLEALIIEAMDYMVRGELELWEGIEGPYEGNFSNDLESMIEYASMQSDPDDVYPGYDRAARFLDMVSEQRELDAEDLWRGSSESGKGFNVDHLMRGLQ
ncbi:restriction endonuclease [Pseudarthrobacter sp. WHRI 8279]|uniref:nSTAND3 domain-containing NTPase n=1 Tax=Pseudarthrobacter sp. WHRI 8279 TaxID=3162566 RepID=UPI0032EAD77A